MLRFFATLLLIIAIIVALDILLINFLPEGPVTEFLQTANTVVVEWVEALIAKIQNMIHG